MDERISLDRWAPPWVRREHLRRYKWACAFAGHRRIVDAACGSGYGAEMLAAEGGALRVDGFDLSADAVAEAKEKHNRRDSVRFAVADVRQLPVPDASYDLYTSFETIEHIADDRAYLQEVVRVLKVGGRFVCSSPNRELMHPGTTLDARPMNPFHVREYVFEEFHALLRDYFSTIEWFGQTYYPSLYCRGLATIGRRLPGLAVRLHQVQKLCTSTWRRPTFYDPRQPQAAKRPEILIAVCVK
jgi:ubiquinone/menaquinone biosynthesis C-methylase UbiE